MPPVTNLLGNGQYGGINGSAEAVCGIEIKKSLGLASRPCMAAYVPRKPAVSHDANHRRRVTFRGT
jgi:hypothetical protein